MNGKISRDFNGSSVRPETCMMDVEFTASAPNLTSRIRNLKKSFGGSKVMEYHGLDDGKTAN